MDVAQKGREMKFKKTKKALAEIWRGLERVPDCPACGGTGEAVAKHQNWAITVWWKGQEFTVCHNCEGRGKV